MAVVEIDSLLNANDQLTLGFTEPEPVNQTSLYKDQPTLIFRCFVCIGFLKSIWSEMASSKFDSDPAATVLIPTAAEVTLVLDQPNKPPMYQETKESSIEIKVFGFIL